MAEDAMIYREDHVLVTNDTPPTRPEGLLQVREGCREPLPERRCRIRVHP